VADEKTIGLVVVARTFMVHNDLWRTQRTGAFLAENYGFRLLVQGPEEVGGTVRFLVVRRGTGEFSDTLIGSGTEETVRAAMAAAVRMA
jgi:hypothetical protein